MKENQEAKTEIEFLLQKKVSLAPLTTWKVGGEAEFFCEPTTEEQIKCCARWAVHNAHPIFVLSGGSNVLISDHGLPGLTISLRKFRGLKAFSEEGRWKIEAKAGTSKVDLGRAFLKKNLSPALFLSGLPGDVGGGIVMNAGVREAREPREFCQIVDWVHVYQWDCDREVTFANEDLRWNYRQSQGWQPGIILKAQLSWPLESIENIRQEVRAANALRLSKQPLDQPSCGSVFRNPEGKWGAGALIEKAGLKGRQLGGAQISPKHANFIVNCGGAKATEIADLIALAQREVSARFNVELIPEVVRLGF